MRITTLMFLLLISPLTLGIEWCNDSGECFKQEKGHKLVQVPWGWKTAEICNIRKGAKGITKSVEPEDPCDKLGVSPETCEKTD